MSDTFFTASPHWHWWIVLYFFLGGIAGGALPARGPARPLRPAGRPPAGRGSATTSPSAGAVVSGLLLTIDLDRPERFWHMLIQSNTGRPMFKSWSPMSVGSWGAVALQPVRVPGSVWRR